MKLAQKIVAVALAATFTVAPASAAPISPKLQKAMDAAGASGKIRILVHVKDATPVRFGVTLGLNDSRGRAERESAFRANAATSQKALLAEFRSFGVTNAVDSAKTKSFWLANAVAMDADRETVEKLAARGDVRAVYLNETIPLPKVTASPAKNVPGNFTWGLTRIHVPEVRKLFKLTGAGVRVGHLDTGAAANHPDLAGKVLKFKDFSKAAKAEAYDDEGHGSHTAGTILGGDAGGKHIGVAPDAKLICAKIFGADGATLEGIIGAMEWVVDPDGNPSTDDGAQIVSNSWGSDDSENTAFWDAVKKWVELGVFPSFACGNNGPNTVGTPGGFPHSFAVGATDPDDALSEFSSRGPVKWDGKEYIKPDVAAPGSGVLSAWHTGNGYTAIQGTSMACPHVSGIVALLLQANPKLTIDRVREILESTAEDKGDAGKDNLFGSGIVNAWKAVAQVVPSGELAGVLKDGSGQGVTGEVTLTDFEITVKTDEQGRFSLTVPAGDYKVAAKAFGFKGASFQATVAAGQATAQDVALEKAQDGKLAGTVVNKDGKPLKASLSFPGTSLNATETTSDTGAFEVNVPQGQYTLVVKSFGYEPKVITDLEVGAQTTGYKITLENLPDLLLVDDDQHDRLESYFAESLTRQGRKFTNWDSTVAGVPAADVLIQYPMVVWHTGFDYRTALTAPEQDSVKKYLASGGHLFLSGQLVGVNLRGTPFFSDVMHAKFVTIIRRSQTPIPAVIGADADKVTTGVKLDLNGEGTQDNQDFPSILKPADAKATLCLNWQGEARGGAALKMEDGAAKMIYTGFGLEGVRDTAVRDDFFKRVLKYLEPTPQTALARVEAVDAIRTRLLSARSTEAASYFEYESFFVSRAAKALSAAPDAEAVLAKFSATCKATDAVRTIRRTVRGSRIAK